MNRTARDSARDKEAQAKAQREKDMQKLTKKLTTTALGMLLLTTYEQEREWPVRSRALIMLVTLGLFEKNPTSRPSSYRATELGGDLIKFWARKHS